MIQSMTGFGRSEGVFAGRKITLDLKSLNSKSLDLNIKMPARYKEKEFELRKIFNERLVRGKIDCYITVENLSTNPAVSLNETLVQAYMNDLKKLAADGPDFEYLKMAVRMPDVVAGGSEEMEDGEWSTLKEILEDALLKFENFRQTEGAILHEELTRNLQNIAACLQAVEPYETVRLDTVKERYRAALQDFEQLDETRFYQEMAYHTEKLDISEEKVRLAQHLKYYEQVMENENFNGKKLGFISQEIGREINTLGSKANHAEIQKLVVQMKDDLEKIKEQTLNVL